MKHMRVLVDKTDSSMVGFLIHYITQPYLAKRCVDGKSAITFGPAHPVREVAVYPHELAGFRFQKFYKFSYSNFRRYIAEDMDMVRHTSDSSYLYAPVRSKRIDKFIQFTLMIRNYY